jgi:hypothetical protein
MAKIYPFMGARRKKKIEEIFIEFAAREWWPCAQ